ncbi:DUF4855 domain-containing protein [Actinocatenispora rupis]|uniref:F5/8 type C domain-containing protein n=1 Tax=Actinocatenispora rupis TaxID=519421 RepID=A0A8J3NB85_9ACTN|nr:DUF4855 domain-containing protein [Actinocatenispora rupis]GID10387.1 hypothetical protein Aru02nite_12760 [Actinocatenispora rupis]
MQRAIRRWTVLAAAAVGTVALVAVTAAPAAAARHGKPHAGYDVAHGKSYTVSVGVPDAERHQTEESAYPDRAKYLTDGALAAGTDFSSPGWVGYLQQVSRTVTLDLGDTKTIDSLSTDWLFYGSAMVWLPGTVRYSLSTDGQTYRVAGEVAGDNTGVTNQHRQVSLSIKPTYARYVRVTFDTNGWTFLDELTVMGTDGVRNGSAAPGGAVDTPVAGCDQTGMSCAGTFLPQGTAQTGGVSDMYLAYTYDTHGSDAAVGTWSADELKPVLTHVNGQGQSDDWMFDTVLFMAGGADYPTKADWDDMLDRVFAPGSDVAALDQAAGTAQATLGDRTVRVVLAIPDPVDSAAAPWGTLDGTTIDLNPERVGQATADANNAKVVDWYVQQATARFNAGPHSHIQLAGFYWMNEAIAPNSSEQVVAQHTAATLHAQGRKFYWIPAYQSPGFQHWREYGFDASMQQPNYFFSDGIPPGDPSRLDGALDLSRWSGQGMEVEGDSAMLTDAGARQKFLEYLSSFQAAGADRGICGWYWGTKSVLAQTVTSTDPDVRDTYDAAYRFISASR